MMLAMPKRWEKVVYGFMFYIFFEIVSISKEENKLRYFFVVLKKSQKNMRRWIKILVGNGKLTGVVDNRSIIFVWKIRQIDGIAEVAGSAKIGWFGCPVTAATQEAPTGTMQEPSRHPAQQEKFTCAPFVLTMYVWRDALTDFCIRVRFLFFFYFCSVLVTIIKQLRSCVRKIQEFLSFIHRLSKNLFFKKHFFCKKQSKVFKGDFLKIVKNRR